MKPYGNMEKANLDFLIHNIILPPKVPQERPDDLRQKDFGLLRFVAEVAQSYAKILGSQGCGIEVAKAANALDRMVKIHNPRLNFQSQLQAEVRSLKPGDAFGVHIVEQNAGITFRRIGNSLQLETFEVSTPQNVPVACKGRLQCNYPGPTTIIPWEIAEDSSFLDQMSEFLHHMTSEQFTSETLSKSRKGGNTLNETRSSPSPEYIISLFTGMMRAVGKEIRPDAQVITKSIRDECNWNNADLPWRRSGMWLVIRVALQTTISDEQYKLLILEVIRTLLDQTIIRNHDSYAISCISKKLARRCQKMKDKVPSASLARIVETMERGSALLKKRWETIAAESSRTISWSSELSTASNIADNTSILLQNSLPWITKRLHEYENPQSTGTRIADPTEVGRFLSPDSFPSIFGSSEVDKAISLIDFETWVQKHLETWCSQTNDNVVGRLNSKMQEYHKEAAKIYKDHNILDISRMILTILEMWVCLDSSVCTNEPLLKEYSPEVPHNLLEPLLFIQKSDMQRVAEVEKYLCKRHSESTLYPSIFTRYAASNSFASRYYATSRPLQDLREKITTKATEHRKAKIKELKRENARYSDLKEKARNKACDLYYNERAGRYKHARGCEKCRWDREANSMSIIVHEWPLPCKEVEAQCVIFELQPPPDFAQWRDATYYLMMEVCSIDSAAEAGGGDSYRFNHWDSLHQNETCQGYRITWASRTKPISGRSHYKSRNIPAVESDVVVNHAGQFRLYDSKDSGWVESQHQTCTAKPLCNSQIDDGTYRNLSYAVNDVLHTHNEIIARQFECPSSLTLREYDAFTTLRSGYSLQWHNILMELHKRDLTFNKDAVYLLILHAACHLGRTSSLDDWCRDSHTTLSEECFSLQLIDCLEKSLSIVESNWEQAVTLKTLIVLARRLISCGHSSAKSHTLAFLKRARQACNPWIESIKEKIQEAQEESKIKDLRKWLLRVAGIQLSTFDVDQIFLSEIFEKPTDVTDYLVCLNIIYDNSLGVFRGLPRDLELLLEQNRRFSVAAESSIEEKLRSDEGDGILTSTTERILTGRAISGTWEQVTTPASRWWALRPSTPAKESGTVVHLNVLEGQILVNGKPNGRLPSEYFTHDIYKRLLGNTVLDVIASEKPGVSYETKGLFCGLKLHFHLEAGELTIRKHLPTLNKQELAEHEFIPLRKFMGDIPMTILQSGTQWLDFRSKKIIFYQQPEWWNGADPSEDWILELVHPGFNARRMRRNGHYLLDLNGNIHQSITEILSPIEDRNYIVATKTDGSLVNFILPRYKLDFFLNESDSIECRSIRGLIVDQNQNVGTLIGLKSFLKLRPNGKASAQECMLLPYGDVMACKAKSGHASVFIEAPESDRNYAVYHIDRVMNKLVDDGTMKARYTRLYLHAVCGGILPDPLTGRTGVAEALDGLRSAASFSFQTLQDTEAALLKLIAKLTPNRSFYPPERELMQQVRWAGNLPVWVQNDNFYPLVAEIFEDWSSRQFLIENSIQFETPEYGSIDLLIRARYHNSIFDEGDTEKKNRISHSYSHQLRHIPNSKEAEVYNISKDVIKWSQFTDLESNLADTFMDLEKLRGIDASFVPSYTPEAYACDPIENWCDLYSWCQNCTKKDRFCLLFTFGSWIYRNAVDKKILKTLITIAAIEGPYDIQVPSYELFQPRIGLYPERSFIDTAFYDSIVPYWDSKYSSASCSEVPKYAWESHHDHSRRRKQYYDDELTRQRSAAVDEIMSQSKVDKPGNPRGNYDLLRVTSAMQTIRSRFEICRQNRELHEYLATLGNRLKSFTTAKESLPTFDTSTIVQDPLGERLSENWLSCSISLEDLLNYREAPDLFTFQQLRNDKITQDFFENLMQHMVIGSNDNEDPITPIIFKLKASTKPFAQKYGDDLLGSVQALKQSVPVGSFDMKLALIEYLPRWTLWYQNHTAMCLETLLGTLKRALSPHTIYEQLLEAAGLWPTSTTLDIIQQLRLNRRKALYPEWLKVFICFGEAITWLQRSNRLRRFAMNGALQEIEKDVHGFRRQHWKAEDYVDWLLFEIDSEMMIRPIQAKIGQEMMREDSTGNVVMQLNMGEGKSAVIMPAVTAALADTTRLVRPIVLKPLSTQMFQILAQRLSGLCDRRIYFLPFNRGLKIGADDVGKIFELYKRCKSNGDILLTLPEHILSFKLMGMEKLLQGNREFADVLISAQDWLDENTRDVLDESDEILHIRYQLIYTMGKQQALEGDQDRWTLIQDFLEYLQECATEWSAKHPTAIEVLPPKAAKSPTALEALPTKEAKYPTIRIISQEVGKEMLESMAKELCIENTARMPTLSSKLRLLHPGLRQKVFEFITVRNISKDLQDTVLKECKHLKIQFLVLRGLIADGVLFFILRDKRYRVDYGLDSKRSKLAVPYRAKDRPAVKAEFGHPEVVLTLTCLTYYYGGLEDSDLENCFELLLKTDDPDLTYERWTSWTEKYKAVEPHLSKLQGLNRLDEEQKKSEIFPFFKHNKYAIDFFLSELIFPREAKGFPHKLSTSGWDIAREKNNNTTGFSGTNDNRYLLPTSIKQLDLKEQMHTNSLVLMNILRKENNTVIKVHDNGQRLTADEMLREIVGLDPKVRVLLDVGAQILELDNYGVAQEWLKREESSHIHGAVFFGKDDELLVLKRDGKIEPFVSSNLSKQLDQALVYLDEAHTRGTDLKLPVDTRAAVTLGPNLAKDKFVQGCMRMRKLGNGHSLVFLAPPDIYSHIQHETGKLETENVGVSDVLLWTMQEGCRQIQHGFAIWADQGFQYLKRSQGWDNFRSDGDIGSLEIAIQEPESRPLLEMYGVDDGSLKVDHRVLNSPNGKEITRQLDEFNVIVTNSVRVQEEQEREVDHEVEEERNIERPEPAKAMQHQLADQLKTLVKSGRFHLNPSVFKPTFSIFASTSCRGDLEDFREGPWAVQSSQFVTNDFSQTIERTGVANMDDYLRPVRWILEFPHNGQPYLVFISPYEANELMSDIKESRFVRLHCYAPRVSRSMSNFEYFSICPLQQPLNTNPKLPLDVHSRIMLNLFAGQLFFENEQYYQEICKYLSLDFDTQRIAGHEGNDGWVSNTDADGVSVLSFKQSPIPFLKAITKMRRKGQGFASTHLGGLLDSRVLGKDDFTSHSKA
ncbi:hypothetical protein TWF217_000476 [Orbilia oligospora]|nr:hypothetical protein TWF217_000476 [Orbilia oligospora]